MKRHVEILKFVINRKAMKNNSKPPEGVEPLLAPGGNLGENNGTDKGQPWRG
jgi:hypothetical protein